jgi:hypothetical protein
MEWNERLCTDSNVDMYTPKLKPKSLFEDFQQAVRA